MSEMAAAYDASGHAWRHGPDAVYERLAEALIGAGTLVIDGRRVLDVGSGTGAAARAARRHGAASVVAVDLALGMLRHSDVRAVAVADSRRLPFRDAGFDVVLAGFTLGHLPDPVSGLREARRVAAGLLASAFGPLWGHPAKAAVDETMGEFGFILPSWYAELKTQESGVEDPGALAVLAESAGYRQVRAGQVEVPVGIESPGAMVDWRWGMAHLAPFVARLPAPVRADARAACEAAVDGLPPVVVPMLVLSAS